MGLALEEFGAAPAPVSEGPPAAWLEGHAAGLAEGLAMGREAAQAEAAHLSAELAGALGDMAFAYAEARETVLGALGPLFAALCDRLLPGLAAAALGPWIAEVLAEAARSDSACPVTVALHPSRIGAVAACLPADAPVRLIPDAALGPHAARIDRAGEETDLDLDACLATLTDALASLAQPPEILRHA